jgi:hypothetical protein
MAFAKKRPGEYWVVNQILAKQLHTASEEMLSYTTRLMDKLEEVDGHSHFRFQTESLKIAAH